MSATLSSDYSSVSFVLISPVLSRRVEVAWTEDFPKRRVLHISTLHAKTRGCQASCDQPPLAWQALVVPASSILVGIRWQNVLFNSLFLLSRSTSLTFSSFRSPGCCKSAGRVGLRAVLSLSRTTSHAHSPGSRFQLYSCHHLFRAGHRSFPYHLILILCTAGPTWQILQPAHSHQFLYFLRPYSLCFRRIVVRHVRLIDSGLYAEQGRAHPSFGCTLGMTSMISPTPVFLRVAIFGLGLATAHHQISSSLLLGADSMSWHFSVLAWLGLGTHAPTTRL